MKYENYPIITEIVKEIKRLKETGKMLYGVNEVYVHAEGYGQWHLEEIFLKEQEVFLLKLKSKVRAEIEELEKKLESL